MSSFEGIKNEEEILKNRIRKLEKRLEKSEEEIKEGKKKATLVGFALLVLASSAFIKSLLIKKVSRDLENVKKISREIKDETSKKVYDELLKMIEMRLKQEKAKQEKEKEGGSIRAFVKEKQKKDKRERKW